MKRAIGAMSTIVLLVAACSAPAASSTPPTAATSSPIASAHPTGPPSTVPPASAPPTTAPATTAATAATTAATGAARTAEGPGPLGVEVTLPEEPAGAPVAVLVHGGGWLGGAPSSMSRLAQALADRGTVVFNASYRTLLAGGAYPAMFDDVACAVRYARHRAGELGATGDVTLVGHSAGAHLVAAIALTDEIFGGDCPWEGSSVPDRWVGLAGIYRLENVTPVMEALFGGPRAEMPEVWATADPYLHLEAAAGSDAVIVHGLDDEIVPSSSSQDFAFALETAGQQVTFELIEGADHMDLIDPQVTADLIAAAP